jgi:hypothetical protein
MAYHYPSQQVTGIIDRDHCNGIVYPYCNKCRNFIGPQNHSQRQHRQDVKTQRRRPRNKQAQCYSHRDPVRRIIDVKYPVLDPPHHPGISALFAVFLHYLL